MTDTNPDDIDLTADKGYVLAKSFFHLVVCVPKSWSDERIESFAGAADTSWDWRITDPDNDVFPGEVRAECPDDTNRIHVVLSS
jgi:hypothetical protein